MQIKINSWEDRDYLYHEEMRIDGKEALSVHPLAECPEDAIIGRDLISCQQIAHLMKLSYDAGKNGESFDVQVVNEEADL